MIEMAVREQQLRDRTKAFALRVLRLYRSLPERPDAQAIGKQLVRSGTSVAANHRAATRARSRKEFTYKLGLVVEEADETQFWLELLMDAGIMKSSRLNPLKSEAKELTAIFTAAYKTARKSTARDL
jgi:four helix bundle protein